MGRPIEELQAIRRIRDYAVALSLAPNPVGREEAERLIAMRQTTERTANSAAQAEQKRVLEARVADLSREIAALEAISGGAEPDNRLEELRRDRLKLTAEITALQATIRSRREEYEARLVEEELKRLDREENEEVQVEAAPEETASRSKLRLQLAGIDDEIAAIVQASAATDARNRLMAARAEQVNAVAELKNEDQRASAETARLLERQAIETEEFRRAFEIGSTARPAFEVMRDRTTTAAKDASQFWRNPEVQP
jgi:hypothetical protein